MSVTAEDIVVRVRADLDDANRKIANFQATVARTSSSVTTDTDKVARGFSAAGKSSAEFSSMVARAAKDVIGGSRMMGSSLTDVAGLLQGSRSPFLLLEKQGAAAAAGLGLAEGASGALAGILTGGLVLGVTAAGSALGILIEQLLKEGDATDAVVQKIKEDAEQSERTAAAKDIFTRSVEGQEIATRELNKAMLKEIDTSQDVAVKAYEEARAHLAVELATRKELAAKLALRQDELRATKERAEAPGANSDARALSIGPAQSALDRVQDDIAKNAQSINEAELRVGLTFTKLVEDQAQRAADPIKRINDLYDQRRAVLERSTATNEAFLKSLDKMTAAERNAAVAAERRRVAPQFNALEVDRRAAIKAEQDREAAANRKPPANQNQIGRIINEAQARAIVESIGGRVTSGTRSYDKQAELYAKYKAGKGPLAAPPGSSLHEAGQAVDVAKSAGVTLAKLKAAFDKAGVRVTELLDEGDHFHVGFGRKASRSAKDTSAADAKRAADEALRNQRQFEGERDQLNQELLRSLGSQTQDAATLAQLAIDQVNAEGRAKIARIDADELLGKKTKAQADELRALAGAIGHAQAANIAAALQERLAKEKLQLAEADLANQEDVLSAQLDLADSSKLRRGIEQKLLELKYEEIRLQQEANLAAAIRNKDATGEKIARDRLAVLPTLQGADQQRLDRKYESPGQQLVRSLNSSAGDLKNSFEEVAVHGLQNLNDQLADAIVN